MTRLISRAVMAPALTLLLALPMPAAAQDAATVLATVNGTDITLGHMIAMRARLPEQYQQMPDQVLYDGMLDQLIQQQVLADAARTDLSPADEIGLENESRAFLAGRMIDRAAMQPLSDEALEAAYEENYGSAEPETEYNASHILVATEEEARAIAAQLADGGDFAAIAQEKSTGPSGPGGGDLGWFGAGQMVPEFETAVMALQPGEVGPPVQTQFGWHVVRLNETRAKDAPPMDAVRAELEQELRAAAVDGVLARLTSEAEVTRTDASPDAASIRNTELLTE